MKRLDIQRQSSFRVDCLGSDNVEQKNEIRTYWFDSLSGDVALFKISENLLQCKRLETSRKHPYFEQNQLVHA